MEEDIYIKKNEILLKIIEKLEEFVSETVPNDILGIWHQQAYPDEEENELKKWKKIYLTK